MRPLTLSLLLFWCFLVACRHEQPLTIDSSDPAADLPKLTLLTDPTVCATCHPTHYEEWQGSMHAYAAVDPAFIKMQKLGQKETNGQVDQFCVQCHSPIVSKLGLAPVNYENEDLPPIGLHGVSCQACHRISHVLEARNASFEYDSSSVIFGPLRQPVANTYHTSEYNAIFETSELCGACHNVVNPREIKIENTFDEWLQSPAAAAGQTCQSCHMPSYEGQAAVDGPTREVHRHFFVGVDVALIDFPDRERQRRMVESLLQSAAEISVNPARQARRNDFLPIEVMITSKTAGHHLPSGATADRQMWLSVKVSDAANGRVFYESGGLDANGDGVISAGEIRNASTILRKMDVNGDGKLTVEELFSPRGRGH